MRHYFTRCFSSKIRASTYAASAAILCISLFSSASTAQQADSGPMDPTSKFLQELRNLEQSNALQRILGRHTTGAIYAPSGVPGSKIHARENEIFAILTSLQNQVKVIHGFGDDRRNYFEVESHEQLAANATGALVRTAEILDGDVKGLKNLSSARAGLCKVERFHTEPAPAFCSSVRVGKDIVATAGHCIDSQADCHRTSVVFGFHMESGTDFPEKGIPDAKIYQCKKLLYRKLDPTGADWALLKVDREMESDIPVAQLRNSGQLSNGDEVTVVGYPIGLPVKITGNAVVKSREAAYFRSNPDTYGGNSGSPVYNTRQLEVGKLFVEGLLVRGARDFVQLNPCMKSNWCPSDDGCPDTNGDLKFEEVTYAMEFSHLVKNN